MAERQDDDRAETARRHDDNALIDAAEGGTSGASRSGGRVATDVGTRDEDKRATNPDAGLTASSKSDERETTKSSRVDDEGANG